MGAVAFVVLMAAEFALAWVLFRRSGSEYLRAYGSTAGMIDLGAQIVLALFPVIQVWRR
jgi:hypothetical protein